MTLVSRDRVDPSHGDSTIAYDADEIAAPRRGKSPDVRRLLDAAAAKCAAAVLEDHTVHISEADAEEHVALLCGAVRQAVAGEAPNLGSLPSHVPARRLLDTLRGKFLNEVEAQRAPVAVRDVTAVLRAIEAVQHALELDSAQRFAERLSGPDAVELVVAVAHDMRSPLTSILFLVDALRTGHSGPLTPQQERQLLIIHSAALGLSSMATDVLDLARGGDRLIDSSDTAFSVRECMMSILDIVRPMAEEKKLSLEIVPPEVDLRRGHPNALSRVLLNLTTNALKFTEEGSVRVHAKEISRKRVEFTITDTGRGIPEPVLETIFDAFRRRGRDAQYIFSSSGLGLSMCQKLVSAMGGELSVTNRPEGGTCFSFQLDLPPATRI